jgi:hypothetical protein
MPRLTTTGLAVPVSLDLLPGVTLYRAPSGAGKTTALRAYLALMIGKDEQGKPADLPEGASVEMAFGSTVLHLDAKRRQWGDTVCRSMNEWRECASSWRSVDPGRLLLVSAPHGDRTAWYASLSPLELRDLLIASFSDIPLDGGKPAIARATASLCEDTIRASEFYLDGDPTDPKRLDDRRLDAQRAENIALGAMEQARQTYAALAPPVQVDAEASRRLVEAGDEWSGYLTRRDAWEAARSLGERGTRISASAISAAQEVYESASRMAEHAAAKVTGGMALLAQARAWQPPREPTALVDLRATVRMLEAQAAKPAPVLMGACEACEHGGIAADRKRQALLAELDAARSACFDASEKWESERAEAIAKAKTIEDEARAALEVAEQESRDADLRSAQAFSELDTLRAKAEAWTRWGERRDLLVAQSGLTQQAWSALVSGPEPTAPTSTQPGAVALDAARQALRDLERAEVVASDREDRMQSALLQVEAAEARWEACKVRTERLRHLVKVAREAPATLLPKTIAAIEATGLLGPVSLQETAEGVEVLWKGRAWSSASDGERVFGDVCLRAALRSALGMASSYLWVDRAQDWSPPNGEKWPTESRLVLLDTGSRS